MFLKFDVPFFYMFDRLTIHSICKVFKLVIFEKDDLIFTQGDLAGEMYIILTGSVGIYSDKERYELMVKLKPKSIFGERALISKENTRSKTAAAVDQTICLKLTREDYNSKISYFEHIHKSNRISFLKNLFFTKGWPESKIKQFNNALAEVSLAPN